MHMKYVMENCVTEWAYSSGKVYRDPSSEVELDIVFTDPGGDEHIVPAFWAGEQTWRVRYSSPLTGLHHYRTVCSDSGNADLHGQTGTLQVSPYEGQNPLMMHGPLRMAADRRHLEYSDGTPFFWLGDTWWMGFTKRLSWPDGFRELTADRVAKGFTLVQIVAGLYPDMEPFDARGANQAGFPWEQDLSRINPAYFDMADLRIAHLVNAGLMPCIVGSWGYFMEFAGAEMCGRSAANTPGAAPVSAAAVVTTANNTDTSRPMPSHQATSAWLMPTNVNPARISTPLTASHFCQDRSSPKLSEPGHEHGLRTDHHHAGEQRACEQHHRRIR